MNETARFWDRIAERYSKQPITDQAAYEKKLQATREYLRPDMDVLEIGCGTGSIALAHAPYVKHIHATDISSKMIEIAQGKADTEKIRNITFERSSVEDISAADHSPDAVLALSVLHLLEDRNVAIARMYSLLKPGGVFVSNTACLGGKMNIFRLIVPLGKFLRLMPLVRVFTAKELEDSLTDAGFQIDYQWQPPKGPALFIVAKKPE